MPGSSCRYQVQAPIDYQIQVTCEIDMVDVSSLIRHYFSHTDSSVIISRIGITVVFQKDYTLPLTATKTFRISGPFVDRQLLQGLQSGMY